MRLWNRSVSRYRTVHLYLISVGRKDLEKFHSKSHLLFLYLPGCLPLLLYPASFSQGATQNLTFSLKPSDPWPIPFAHILDSTCPVNFPGRHSASLPDGSPTPGKNAFGLTFLFFSFKEKERISPSDTCSQIFQTIHLPSPIRSSVAFEVTILLLWATTNLDIIYQYLLLSKPSLVILEMIPYFPKQLSKDIFFCNYNGGGGETPQGFLFFKGIKILSDKFYIEFCWGVN